MLLRCIINAFIREEKGSFKARYVCIKWNVEWGVEDCIDFRSINCIILWYIRPLIVTKALNAINPRNCNLLLGFIVVCLE